MLEAQCRSWPGPMTVVLYEPTVVRPNAAAEVSAGAGAAASAAAAGMPGHTSSSSSQNGLGNAQAAALRKLLGLLQAAGNSSSSSNNGSSNLQHRQLLGEGSVSVAGSLLFDKLSRQGAEALQHLADAEKDVQALYDR